MLKRGLSLVIVGTMVFSIYACSSPEGEYKDNIADNGIKGIEHPQGCEVIDNINEFEGVSGNQSYNKITDYNTSFDVLFGGTDLGQTLYFISSRCWLTYFDKKSGKSSLLCGKPDCEHADDTCNAYMNNLWGVQYYNGYLYTVQSGDGFKLKKVSIDGSERTDLGQLIDVENLISRQQGLHMITWMIHRGYIYYVYDWDSSKNEDIFYLNNSNCVYRKSLENDSEPECIMILPMMTWMTECEFIGAGSYVYMNIPTEDETTGYLYRYNIENNKVEWFKEWGNEISGVAIHDDKIYYSENDRNQKKTDVYCFDIETMEKNLFCEVNGLVGYMSYDDEYIYIAYDTSDGISELGVWNWKGEYIANLPSYNEFNEAGELRDLAGSDDENIYIWCMVSNSERENIYNISNTIAGSYTIMEYIEKEDIQDGEYEIKGGEIAGQGKAGQGE